MIRNDFLRLFSPSQRLLFRLRSSQSINIEKLEQESSEPVEVVDEEARIREQEIEKKRNKSRLKVADYNMLHDQNPYPEPTRWHHGTLKYMRRLYGRYGEASGVNPAICWPIKGELQETLEYEKVAFPYTIMEVADEARQKRLEKQKAIEVRQEGIARNLEKLAGWKKELQNKIDKKENDAQAARQKKERLMEEVRMHFGYTVDPRDEKFKEMLEKREKEQKKIEKEARKKAKEDLMMAKMLSKKTDRKKEEKTDN